MNLTPSEISKATGGTWNPPPRGSAIRRVSTDTRRVRAGDLFVALRGERFDAHDFLAQAAGKGAGALAIESASAGKVPDSSTPLLHVSDTLRALGDIATAWRKKCPARRCAIVGSTGKTTTKDILAAILGQAAPTHASPGNFNNLIGLPLTLFDLEVEHRFAALELGMNEPGELTRLTQIAEPDLLLFLNVGVAHVGQFESQAALVAAKAEAAQALRPGVPILYDATSPDTCAIVQDFGEGHSPRAFGVGKRENIAHPIAAWARNIRADRGFGYAFDLELEGEIHAARLPLFGRYNVSNAVAAAAAARSLGISPADIIRELGTAKPAHMRSEIRTVSATPDDEPIALIVDCYNANPDSMRAALESLGEWESGRAGESSAPRTHLVLGDMLELGSESLRCHQELGRQAAGIHPESVYFYGSETPAALEACASEITEARHFGTHEALAERLMERLSPGDRVLFKGSRNNELEKIVKMVEQTLNPLKEQ